MKKKRIGKKQRKELGEFDSQVREYIGKIRAVSYSLENKQMRDQFEAICTIAGEILKKVLEKPYILNSVQLLVGRYLETIYQLAGKYKKLVSLPKKDKNLTELLLKSENAVTEVLRFLEGIQTQLMSDELLDLDIQLSVLETELEIDNL